ncbi:MAG: ABC transporter transmembrane domain-containing protein [Pseudonocardia sp.]
MPPVLALLNLLAGPLDRRSTAEQERAAHATAVAGDLVSGLRVLNGMRGAAAGTARYRRASRDSPAARLRAARLGTVHSGATPAVTSAFLAIVALVGGRLAVRGEITVGELVAAVGLTQYLIGPMGAVAETVAGYAQSRASARRVAGLLAAPDAVREGRHVPGDGGVRLTGLAHGTLGGLDLDTAPGELLGVVAADPADAAALLECLAREAEPSAGDIEVGAQPVEALRLDAVRARLLVAAHEPDLLEPTPMANVTATAASPALAGAALAAAAADQVVATVGADTELTERARSLSGGQRQRLALAPALATGAPVLGPAPPDHGGRRRHRVVHRATAARAAPRPHHHHHHHHRHDEPGAAQRRGPGGTGRGGQGGRGGHARGARRHRTRLPGGGALVSDTLLPVASPAQVRAALATLVRPQWGRVAAAALALVAATVAALLAPPLLGAVVDVAVSGRPPADVTTPVPGLLAVALATGVLDATGRALLARAGEPVLADLRERVVERALAVPPDHVERAGTGDLLGGGPRPAPARPPSRVRPPCVPTAGPRSTWSASRTARAPPT